MRACTRSPTCFDHVLSRAQAQLAGRYGAGTGPVGRPASSTDVRVAGVRAVDTGTASGPRLSAAQGFLGLSTELVLNVGKSHAWRDLP